eukprot:PRCOL_00003321-RA
MHAGCERHGRGRATLRTEGAPHGAVAATAMGEAGQLLLGDGGVPTMAASLAAAAGADVDALPYAASDAIGPAELAAVRALVADEMMRSARAPDALLEGMPAPRELADACAEAHPLASEGVRRAAAGEPPAGAAAELHLGAMDAPPPPAVHERSDAAAWRAASRSAAAALEAQSLRALNSESAARLGAAARRRRNAATERAAQALAAQRKQLKAAADGVNRARARPPTRRPRGGSTRSSVSAPRS